ncbi:MAG: hypothetical protein WCW93_01175 [Candidatus Paceibacterota bacterium]
MIKKLVIVFVFIFTALLFFGSFAVHKIIAADCSDSIYAKANETACLQEQKDLEAQFIELSKQKAKLDKQSSTYALEVKKLTTQINALNAKIKARVLVITQLKIHIGEKVNTINSLSKKIDREHSSLAQLLRNTNEFDNNNLVNLILSNESIFDFYSDLESYNSIKQAIKDSVDVINGVKTETEVQKKDLEIKQDAETDAKYELESAQKQAAQLKTENSILKAGVDNQAATVKKLADEKKARANKIRNALIQFQGSGISNKEIKFGEAYDYAKKASLKTGVRAALILAIMQQETSFGSNFGGCYVTNLTTGDGKGINTGAFYEKVMGLGSLGYFKRITESLGLDWSNTPVSCPIDIKGRGTATKYYDGRGYGGAMGYTQFIPSTWVLVEARVCSNLLVETANPWNPEHAVMATAVHLQDLGAGKQTYTAEHNAACKYYGSCSSYASSVMKKATSIQMDIDNLED